MAFSGGSFSRLYNWVNDRNAAINITASRMDAEMDGMATGLSTCILKDGTQTVTANIPMAGYKFTGLGAGSANGDSVRYEQLFGGSGVPYVATIELGHTTDTTLGRSAAGQLSVEAGAGSLYVASIELGHASDSTLSRLEAGVLGVEGAPFSAKASSFFVAKTATQAINATTATTVTWSEAATGAHDTGSDFASNAWTAPYTGVVSVSAAVTVTGTAAGEFFFYIRRNTTALGGAGGILAASGGYGTGAAFASVTNVITVTAGDTLDVRIYCSAAMTIENDDPVAQSGLASYFTATYV